MVPMNFAFLKFVSLVVAEVKLALVKSAQCRGCGG